MVVDNSGEAPSQGQTLNAQSISLSQRIPGLCTGSAYVLKWSSRIDISAFQQKKRAPTPNDECTVSFDLVDQVVSVTGGPQGAPLPYTQTRNGDIFRYKGFLDYNILTITLNCSASRSSYFVDDISFMGPSGTCCQSVIAGPGAESTAYSLATIGRRFPGRSIRANCGSQVQSSGLLRLLPLSRVREGCLLRELGDASFTCSCDG